MIATVTCYSGTGLTMGNCLDNSALLDSLGFSKTSYPNIAIKQDRGLIKVRINATYDKIKDSDYVKINDNCYWLLSINMLNDNVAELTLQQDYLTTVGISLVEVVGGWCTRRHVTDDTLYNNVIDEPFTPSNEIEIERGTMIQGSSKSGFYSIVLSTVDLINIENTAKAYFDDDEDKILVPELPIVNGTITEYTSHLVSPAKTAYISLSNAYVGSMIGVQEGIKAVRQLGIESCIGASYMLPKAWATIANDIDGLVHSLEDCHQDVTSNLKPTWGSYKNNKVYSGQFNKIVLFSIASGDSQENRVEDVVDSSGNVVWATYADTRYSGRPGCKPKYYKGVENTVLFQAVHGANWQQTPFIYGISSGYGYTAEQSTLRQAQNQLNLVNGIASGLVGIASGGMGLGIGASNVQESGGYSNSTYGSMFGSIGGMAQSALGVASTIGNYQLNKQMNYASTNQALVQGANEVAFPQVPNLADYVGNAFFDIRYKLSDNDMQRFDDFLSEYGYAVDEKLTHSCFSGRTHFNYVMAHDVILKKSNVPQYLLSGMSEQIEQGVRIWHDAPSLTSLTNNPIS